MEVKNRPNISIEFLRFIIGPTAPRNTIGFMGIPYVKSPRPAHGTTKHYRVHGHGLMSAPRPACGTQRPGNAPQSLGQHYRVHAHWSSVKLVAKNVGMTTPQVGTQPGHSSCCCCPNNFVRVCSSISCWVSAPNSISYSTEPAGREPR